MLLKTQDFTPDVYYRQSRDFQFIGRLFDVVLNSVKTNADMLYNLPLSEDSDERLLQLMTLTLGFKPRHQYNNRQLKAFCSVFAQIIRNKGNAKSFQLAVRALANAQGLEQGQIEVAIDKENKFRLLVSLPSQFKGHTLLRDLLEYILPAGMSCRFTTGTLYQLPIPLPTKLGVKAESDTIKIATDVHLATFGQVVSTSSAQASVVDDTSKEQMQSLGIGEYGLGTAIISTLPTASVSENITLSTTDSLQKIALKGSQQEDTQYKDSGQATIELYNLLDTIADKQQPQGGNS